MRLGQGDMRRVLNLLQSTHMAYQKVKGGIPKTTSVVVEKQFLLIESDDEKGNQKVRKECCYAASCSAADSFGELPYKANDQ